MKTHIHRKLRRAMSTVETGIALALIAVVVSTGGYYLSNNTSAELEDTADGIADPAHLAQKFLD